MDLETCSQQWLDAKQAEREAVERRRDAEDKLLSLIGIAENMDGTENVETDSGFKLKIVGRMNRKVDGDRVQEIAAEEGLEEHLPSLFRWKPEINMPAWKKADESITTPLLGGITTTPGRASFTITKEAK
tara:strand:+ start:1169 stop:1558 length:390 start_codon:yes stop_codon:yes gene_type:complete